MAAAAAIELKDVEFSYTRSPSEVVLKIPQWHVPPGDQVFVHGPSGTGKSTLLNLLSGMLQSTSGSTEVLGSRLDRMNSRQRDRFRANHIGYVFQRFNLISYLSAVDNIELARGFSAGARNGPDAMEAPALLRALNIDETIWHKPAAALSAGQQQRVAIARALINRPQLLIADEPTSSLDSDNRDSFMELLMPLVAQHNMTLLFVSHDMSLAQYFSRVEPLSDFSRQA